MARFLVCYVDPDSGLERLGTGPSAQTVLEYANIKNVIRFGLAYDHFPVGKYNIYLWPSGGGVARFQATAHKTAGVLNSLNDILKANS